MQILEQLNLSLRDFAGMCGGAANGAAPSTVRRVLMGEASEHVRRRTLPMVGNAIRRRLAEIGSDPTPQMTPFLPQEDVMERRTILTRQQQQHFGLTRDPFSDPPQSREEAWFSPDLEALYARIKSAATGQGFLAVCGAPGAGKSELRKRLVSDAKKSAGALVLVWPEYRDMRSVTVGMIYAAILRQFSQPVPQDLDLRERRLCALLEARASEGVSIALCYEEAHELDDRVLRVQKRFHELGDGGYERWLGVLLFGQERLAARLEDFRFSEVAQRIEIASVPALTAATAWSYVQRRMTTAGVSAEAIIDKSLVTGLAQTHRTPLALGNACNRALTEAWAVGEKKATAAVMRAATGPQILQKGVSA